MTYHTNSTSFMLLLVTFIIIIIVKELQTALMLSVSSGSLGLVTLLLEAGADINAQDKVSTIII